MNIPKQYALTRNQAPLAAGNALAWFTTIIAPTHARALFSIEEGNGELTIGQLLLQDLSVVEEVFKTYIQKAKPLRIENNSQEIVLALATFMSNASPLFVYRLTTKVNKGVKIGTQMGINGLESIISYLKTNSSVDETYMTIDYVQRD